MVHNLRSGNGALYPATSLTSQYVAAYLSGSGIPGDPRYLRFARPVVGALAVLQALGVDLKGIQVVRESLDMVTLFPLVDELLISIQLIWDFHTASEELVLRKMKYMRSRAISRTRLDDYYRSISSIQSIIISSLLGWSLLHPASHLCTKSSKSIGSPVPRKGRPLMK